MDQFKILYLASEVAPFARSTSVADVTGALPKALKNLDHEIRIMMPKYKFINERKFVLREVIRLREIPVTLNGKTEIASVKSAFLPDSKVQIYFVDIPNNFDRDSLYVDPQKREAYEDNAERFAFFCKAAMETLKTLSWQPDVIHCNDWQTAYVPVYLKTIYQGEDFFKGIKTIYTMHNLHFQGAFNLNKANAIEFDENEARPGGMFEKNGKLNLTKAAIYFSDFITTVSENYANEIIEADEKSYGFGDLLDQKGENFEGILNGVDYSLWTPEKNKKLPAHYTHEDLSGKEENKKTLLTRLGMQYEEGQPLVGVISNINEQKGMDIVLKALPDLMKLNIKMCILGQGDPDLIDAFMEAQQKYSGNITVTVTYDDKIAHLMEAGSDIFLIPSRNEPCGLYQIVSMKFGTVPVVAPTGGLLDTVDEYDEKVKHGTGFIMEKHDAKSLVAAVKKALAIYEDKEQWAALQKSIMQEDYSWDISAKRYVDIYTKVLGG